MAAKVQDLGVWGTKVGMTQVFDEEGDVVPVTIIQLADNVITEIRTKEKDGYSAVQVGSFPTKTHRMTKPERMNLEKRNLPLFRNLKEFRCHEAVEGLAVGEALNLEEFFKDLKKVDIRGTSIGKGFQGGIKLHNMTVGSRSHGSKSKRIIGSLSAGTTPGRVYRGKRMPAMMGNHAVTLSKSKVFKYDAEKKLLLVRGGVTGKTGSIVTIKAYGIKTWNHYNKEQPAA